MSQNSASKTILLVEDEALLAMGKKIILEKNGYKVTHVLRGDAAIQAVEAGGIDLILMDIDLGRNKMDGTEAAEKILEKHTVPIIFHTSHSEKEMVDKVKGITRYGYVLKSAGEFVLIEAIQMAFELFNANRKIIEKEERYQYMFEYSRSCVAVLKAVDEGNDFVFIDYNQTAEETDKIRKDEVIGNRVTEVFPGVKEFGLLDVFRTVWRTGETKAHTDAFYSDERISGWRESLVYKMPSGEIVSVYRDVTEEKENEEKLQVTSDELECLYMISQLVGTEGITLPEILQGTIDLLPRYIGETGKMSIRLSVDCREYVTENFKTSQRERTVLIFIHGEEAGKLEIYCNKRSEECIKEAFLEGFDMFLNTLAERMGKIIERYKATEKLKQSEENYRSLVESIHEGIWSIDKNSNTTYVNPRMAEMLGYRVEEMVGKHLFDFIADDAKAEAQRQLARRQSGKTDQHQFTFRKKDGTEVHTLVGATPIVNEGGVYSGALAVVMDITHVKEVEAKLKERKENYRNILESIGDAVISTDIQGNITRTNHIAREMIGCSEGDIRNKPLYDVFTLYNSEDGKPIQNPVETVLTTEKILTLSNHTKLISRYGKELHIADSVAPVHDARGETRGAVLVFRDETEKYEQERRLRESEERYRRLFENMAEGFIRTDAAGNIILVNQAAAELYGYDSIDDLAGRHMADLYVDPSARSGLLKRLGEEKQFRNHEFLLKQKSGNTLWTLCNIKLLMDEDGNFAGTEGLFRDYTDKKALEIERERNESFLGSILDAIQDPVSVHDGELNIRKANKIVHAMYQERAVIEGRKCYKVYYNRNTPCEECPTLKAFSTKHLHSCMKEISEEGVPKQYFELFACPIIDAQGAVESVVEYARDITELVEREQELQKSNDRFQALFNNTSVMLVIDPETGEIQHANTSALQFYGYSYEEITAMRIQDINMLSEEEVKQEMAAAAAANKTHFNFRHRLASGEVRDVEVYSGRVGWGAKDVLCSVIHDVTEKNRAEEKLHISDIYYRNVLQFLPVFVLDREFRYLHVNDLAADLVHMKAEELAGKKITDLFAGFEETGFYKLYKKVLQTNKASSITAPFTLPDGSPGTYRVHVLPCPEGIQCIAIDITEEKKTEKVLQRALYESERLQYVVHNSPVCAFTWRNEKGWPVEYVSENVDSLLGYEAEDFISEKIEFRELIHPEDRVRVEDAVRNYLNTGKTEYSQEYRMTAKDGSVRWVEDKTSVELNEEGEPVLFHGLVWDITQRKEAELKVKKQRKYEKAVAKVSTILLTAKSEIQALQEALTRLRKVSEVSRIYIFENFNDPDDGLCMRQTYEVCAPDVSPEIDNPILQHVVYNDGFSRWRELLSSGKAVWGNIEDFPEEEQHALEPQEIVSILVLPLVIRGEWRGLVGFDDTCSPYRWSRNESLLLQTACDLIGGFLGRMESEKTIKQQLQEKELLIRETHHRIKNNITSIYGLLHLQAETVENDEARSILNQAISRVNSMRDLYEKMLSADDIRIISVAPYLNDLIYSNIPFFSFQTAVTVERNIADFTLDSDKLFSLGIIVNELLTNAMKYAFPGRDTGIIRVSCEKREHHVSLVVHDDGIGLPDGFHIEHSTGLGMDLVHMLSRQLNGTVRFENDNGAKVTLEFTV